MKLPEASFLVEKKPHPYFDDEVFTLIVDDGEDYEYLSSDLTSEEYQILNEYATAHKEFFED